MTDLLTHETRDDETRLTAKEQVIFDILHLEETVADAICQLVTNTNSHEAEDRLTSIQAEVSTIVKRVKEQLRAK